MSLKLPALALMALVSATVIAPSAAGAAPRGSIVFSDKGNIWLIGADGSGESSPAAVAGAVPHRRRTG